MSAANEQGFEVVNAEDAKPDMAEPQDHVEAKGAEKQEEEEEEEVEVEEEVEEEEIEEEEEEGDVEQEIEQEGQEEPQQQAIAEEKAAETSSEQQPSTSGPSAHGTNVSLDELETKAKALLKDGAEAIDKVRLLGVISVQSHVLTRSAMAHDAAVVWVEICAGNSTWARGCREQPV